MKRAQGYSSTRAITDVSGVCAGYWVICHSRLSKNDALLFTDAHYFPVLIFTLYIQHSFCGSGNPMPSKSIYFHNKQVQTVTTGTFHTDASLTGATK